MQTRSQRKIRRRTTSPYIAKSSLAKHLQAKTRSGLERVKLLPKKTQERVNSPSSSSSNHSNHSTPPPSPTPVSSVSPVIMNDNEDGWNQQDVNNFVRGVIDDVWNKKEDDQLSQAVFRGIDGPTPTKDLTSQVIDLYLACKEDLMDIPGVDEDTAQKVIELRSSSPYLSTFLYRGGLNILKEEIQCDVGLLKRKELVLAFNQVIGQLSQAEGEGEIQLTPTQSWPTRSQTVASNLDLPPNDETVVLNEGVGQTNNVDIVYDRNAPVQQHLLTEQLAQEETWRENVETSTPLSSSSDTPRPTPAVPQPMGTPIPQTNVSNIPITTSSNFASPHSNKLRKQALKKLGLPTFGDDDDSPEPRLPIKLSSIFPDWRLRSANLPCSAWCGREKCSPCKCGEIAVCGEICQRAIRHQCNTTEIEDESSIILEFSSTSDDLSSVENIQTKRRGSGEGSDNKKVYHCHKYQIIGNWSCESSLYCSNCGFGGSSPCVCGEVAVCGKHCQTALGH